ncbi:hypothetical protein Hte_005114 [Hypoxylon texense]
MQLTESKLKSAQNWEPRLIVCDYADMVEEAGFKLPILFKKGDRVAGLALGSNGSHLEGGMFGEYDVVKAGLTIKVPDNVTGEEGVVLGLGIAIVGQRLYWSLKLLLPTRPTSKPKFFLTYGGSTPTGVLGAQSAKLLGFTVITTSSPKNSSYI